MLTLSIVGGGKMGEALVAGLLDARWASPDEIIVAEVVDSRREELTRTRGVRVTAESAEAAAASRTLLIAVKPQDMAATLEAIAPAISGEHLVLSIAAGITTAFIEKRLPDGVPVVRIMPNTPALVREGMAALAPGRHARDEHLERAETILATVGRTVRLDESHMDAVTAVSGSGPAYLFLLAEMLTDAGAAVGLPEEVASELATQTLLGSARMLRETGREPAALREMVTSPGGTTAAAIAVLEAAGVRQAFLDAVRAATERGRELAAGGGSPA